MYNYTKGNLSSVERTDIGSSVKQTYNFTYDAWGNVSSVSGSLAGTLGVKNPLRYRGYVYDNETGFYYLKSRYYDPEIGRFLNADEYPSTGQGVLGNNMFAYCKNNPLTRYSKKWLADNELRVQIKVAGTKRGVHEWQHYMIENYTLISGGRPELNKSFW